MPLLMLEGFEGPLFANSGWTDVSVTYGPGRSGKCAQATGGTSRIESRLTFSAPTVTLGAAFRIPAAPTQAAALFSLHGIAPGLPQTSCNLRTDMTIAVNKGQSGTTLGVGSYTVQVNEWFYLEWQCTFGAAAPTKLRVNNTVVLDLASVDTRPPTNVSTAYGTFLVGSSSSNNTVFFVDDLYANLGTEFLGDIIVEELTPNGNGAVNQFNGSDGNSVDNYLLVADTSASTHTRDSIIGHQDLYQLSNLATVAGDIVGVCHFSVVSKSDSGPAQFRLLNHGAVDTKSSIVVLSGTSTTADTYTYGLLINPETGLPFTIAEVNALQTGIEVA